MMRIFLLLLLMVTEMLPSNGQPYGNEWIDHSKTYFKFPVRENRFFRIPVATLTAHGLAGTPAEHFQLWRDGTEVPIFTSVASGPLPANGFIEFFGSPLTGADEKELYNDPAWQTQPERSFFLDTAWYFLTVNTSGVNKRFTETPNPVLTTTLPADSFYMETARPLLASTLVNGGVPRLIGSDAIRSAVWDKGESFSSGRFDYLRTLEYKFTNMQAFLNGPPLRLQYQVAGVTNRERRAIVSLNNAAFDSIVVPFYDMVGKTIQGIPVNKMSGDTLSIKFNTQYDTLADNVVVTQLNFSYPRRFFHNQQTPIFFNLPATAKGNHIRFRGLPNSTFQPVLYDLTNLKRYTGIIKPDSSLFAIDPSAAERRIVIGTQNPAHIRTVSAMKEIKFRDFRLAQNQGDYLMITHFLLRQEGDPIEAYRAYRNSSAGGGYQAHIYDIDEISEQFSYGVRKNPLGIRRFIRFALDHFSVKPKMVFLIGRGNTYSSYLRAGAANRENMNMIPTWGLPASDNLLASRSNLIPYPEIPIGRLSAVNANEVSVYLDKVVAFEALQRKKPAHPSEQEWRKRIIHLVGGDDVFMADSILWRYMNNFAEIIKVPAPGGIVNQFKRPGNPDFAEQMQFVEKRISEGTGLITYFGHSSVSSIDFNLGSPDMYTNSDGKFPVIIANGCRAGNIFDFTTQRLGARETTISDNFIFAPNKGSIAFISNSDLGSINFQNLLTREWYNSFSVKKFGKTIGEIQLDALKTAWARTANSNASNQFINRCNIEQNILHADPAIVPFMEGLPDFAVEAGFMETNPGKVLTELDSVALKLHYFNLGTAVNDSVRIVVEREMPDGTARVLYNQRHARIYNRDSILISVRLNGLFEEGPGYLVARIDPANEWQEQDKDNNVAVIPFNLQRAQILPVYPANFSIIGTPEVILKAGTTNPLDAAALYRFQFDTTANFNSPVTVTIDTLAGGGLVQWKPGVSLTPSMVYYWRVTPSGIPFTPETPVFSFLYSPGAESGYSQSHFYQHQQSLLNTIELPVHERWTYGPKAQNIYVSHGIFQSSGTEETHFSITTNGEMKMRSACIGRSIIFNLYDSLTFEPIKNTPVKAFGSADSCAPYREYNFEFNYYDHTKRKIIMDFLDSLPKGTFVAARLNADRPYDSLLIKYWKADTAIYGSGRSLYHSLLKYGFYDIDSLDRTRTFFFMFQKGDSSVFKPYSKFSQGVTDRLYASIYLNTTDTSGDIQSPWMGPALQWNKAAWKIAPSPSTPSPQQAFYLQLWGKNRSGQILLLDEWASLSDTVDISGISAEYYPFLQFRLKSAGNFGDLPVQLSRWSLQYTPLPDGAWSPADWYYLKRDTLKPSGDTLRLELAFKNITETRLDTTRVSVTIRDAQGNETVHGLVTLRALNAGDTAVFVFEKFLSLPEGDYQLLLAANESGKPAEQQYFNNRALLPFTVSGGTLPLWLLQFDALRDGKSVRLFWKSALDNGVQSWHVEHGTGGNFSPIARNVSSTESSGGLQVFRLVHDNPVKGNNFYRLRMDMKNGRIEYSDIRKVVFESPAGVMAAPNPFGAYFHIYPLNRDENWQLTIFDASGRQIRAEKGNGVQKIDLSAHASGLYWLHWRSGHESRVIKMLKQ